WMLCRFPTMLPAKDRGSNWPALRSAVSRCDMPASGPCGSEEFAECAGTKPGDAGDAPDRPVTIGRDLHMNRTRAARLAALSLALMLSFESPALADDGNDWPRYARDPGGTRFSPLGQIDKENVKQLEPAWSFRLRPGGGGGLLGGSVPIVIDGVMYLPLGNAVVALEADTGKEIWRHEVQGALVRRAVSYWPGAGETEPRIFYSS